MSNSVLSTGLKTIQSGLENANRHANQINKAFSVPAEAPKEPAAPEESDEAGALIGLNQDKRQVQAGVKLVKTAEELDKTVLDILA